MLQKTLYHGGASGITQFRTSGNIGIFLAETRKTADEYPWHGTGTIYTVHAEIESPQHFNPAFRKRLKEYLQEQLAQGWPHWAIQEYDEFVRNHPDHELKSGAAALTEAVEIFLRGFEHKFVDQDLIGVLIRDFAIREGHDFLTRDYDFGTEDSNEIEWICLKPERLRIKRTTKKREKV